MDAPTVDVSASADTSAAPQGAAPELQSQVRQFVTFTAGDEVFAVDMAPVQEIIRVPDMVRVPLTPSTLDGLANLRGQILPIINLRRMFGYPERPLDDATRAIVIDLGQALGFVVDRVSSVIAVDASSIEDAAGISTTVRSDLVSGLLKDVGGHPMIMVLDFARLIAEQFSAAVRSVGSIHHDILPGMSHDSEQAEQDVLQLVSFEVAEQEYAVAIEDVQEIVQTPETIIKVPHGQPHVLGIMMLRNRVLPLVSLRRMFGFAERAADEQSRIVVVTVHGAQVGVVMDRVNEVLRVARDMVEPMPPLLARESGMADIRQICRLGGGKRLVSIIDASSMFQRQALEQLVSETEAMANQASSQAQGQDMEQSDEEQLVVFRLGKEEFGVPIAGVQEIVRVPAALTHVPKAPDFVEGVINLRGAVLPVIDLRLRLGLAALPRDDRQRIMVFVIEGVCTGFIVDSVAEVLKVARSAIEVSPHLTGEQSRLLSRMANLEAQKRMIQILEPQRLFDSGDLAQLAGLDL